MADVRRLAIGLGIAVALAASWPGSVVAADGKRLPPDPERGQKLAVQLCAGCHVVSSEQTGKVTAGVPSFRAIANRPEQTWERIAKVLIQPHAPMPNIHLTRQEIRDIVGYLDSLRKPEAGAPLLENILQPKKPKRTKPS